MTDKITAALEAADKATPGEWIFDGSNIYSVDPNVSFGAICYGDGQLGYAEDGNTDAADANTKLLVTSKDLAAEVKKLKSALIEYEFALAETEALVMSHESVIEKRDAEIKRLRKWKDDAFCHVEISRNYLSTELKTMKDDGSGAIDQLKQLKDEADRLISEAQEE